MASEETLTSFAPADSSDPALATDALRSPTSAPVAAVPFVPPWALDAPANSSASSSAAPALHDGVPAGAGPGGSAGATAVDQGGPASAGALVPAPAWGDLGLGDASIDGDETISALCDLLGAGRDGPDADMADVEELLGVVAPGRQRLPGLPHGGPLAAWPEGDGGEGGVMSTSAGAGEEEFDLPEPTVPVPDDVMLVPFNMVANWNLRTELDLKQVAFSLRNAEYNPRKHGSVVIRLREPPRTVALVRAGGTATITGSTSEDSLRHAAKHVTRLIQKCGYEKQVRFADYKVTLVMCKTSLHFPIRLEQLATRWRRHALYEPETYCGCVFRTRNPRCTYLVTAGGKVVLSGMRRMDTAWEALRRAYPIFYDCRK